MNGVRHGELARFTNNFTSVPYLTAHFTIERGGIQNDTGGLTGFNFFNFLAVNKNL